MTRGRADMPTLAPAVAAAVVICSLLLAGAALAGGGATAARTVDPNTFAAVKARCPRGTRPAFGGFKAGFDRGGGALPAGMRAAGRAWRVGAANNSTDPHRMRSFAYCGKHPPYSVRTSTKTVAASHVKTIEASCPNGSQLLAGGYRGVIDPTDSEPLVIVTSMRRSGARTLAISAAAIKIGGPATAIAYCGDGPRPVAHHATKPVPGGGSAVATARCPGRTSLVFGGFVASTKLGGPGSKLVAPEKIARAGNGWAATGLNGTATTPGRIASIAYCS